MLSPAEEDEELFTTAGVRANNQRRFTVQASGKFWYKLLHDLETSAEESHHYIEIQRYVLEATEIRQQLKSQGF